MIFVYDPWQAWIVDLDSLLSTDWQELVQKHFECKQRSGLST